MNNKTNLLGQLLLKAKFINQQYLKNALSQQQTCQSKLGEILIAQGVINYQNLYQIIAKQQQLEFVNLTSCSIEYQLLKENEEADYRHYQFIPFGTDQQKIKIALADYNQKNIEFIQLNYPSAQLYLTSPVDLEAILIYNFKKLYKFEVLKKLKLKFHNKTAEYLLHKKQKIFLYSYGFIVLLSSIFYLEKLYLVLFIIFNFIYLTTGIFKMWLFILGYLDKKSPSEEFFSNIKEADLPIYTILIALYQEEKVIKQLIKAINNIDYPKAKLDIILAVEEDDLSTIDAIKDSKSSYNFKIIRVPDFLPKTKPKALNYALRFAKGELITIYDAEDRPDVLQLKKVVAKFKAANEQVICVQAKLNYYNANYNLLTKMFAIEYTIWFEFLLRGLEMTKVPIPLGGTSNHFITKKLLEIGGWDSYNVTEDADLGIRLAGLKYKTLIIDSTTYEESPIEIKSWIKQRSRWIKGYIQTYIVHMREPIKLYKTLGLHGFVGTQIFIGISSISFLIGPIIFITLICYHLNLIEYLIIPDWLKVITFYNLLNSTISTIILALIASWQKKQFRIAILLFPIYYFLHSIASIRSIYQLITKPHYWDKTMHGNFDNK